MTPDPYDVLGVSPQADQASMRAAYLRLMRANHPDRRPGDLEAAERARQINAAWYVLGNPRRRAMHDRARGGAQGLVAADVQTLRAAAAAQRAYAATGRHFRRAVHLAAVKVAAVVFCLGLLVLLALNGS